MLSDLRILDTCQDLLGVRPARIQSECELTIDMKAQTNLNGYRDNLAR